MAKAVVLNDINEGGLRDVAIVRTGMDACLRGHMKHTGKTVVLKLLRTGCCDWLSLVKEAMALGRVCVKQIMLPIGVYRSHSLIGLVWDWMPEGSLHSLLYETQLYPELPVAIRLQILLEVAEGLSHLHAIPLPHGALKTTNILLDHQYHAKLCDWGQQAVLNEKTHVSNGCSPYYRHLTYLAPEVIQGNMPSVQADMYSFGVLICELLNRQSTSEGIDQLQFLVYAQRGKEPAVDTKLLPPETPQCYALTQLMIRCWSSVPKQRPLAKECIVELKKALGTLDLDACCTAVHLLQTCKERALLSCKHTSSCELPIDLNNLEGFGGYADPKKLTSKTIPVYVDYSNKLAPCPDETIRRERSSTRRVSCLTKYPTNSSAEPPRSLCNNPVFRQCVWSATPARDPPPPNMPCGSPSSLLKPPLQHSSAANQAMCQGSSGWTCCRLLQERREAIVHFMTEGRFNNLLDVLRARQAVTQEDYEIITAPITLSGRIRCLLDTCACLGESVSILVAATLGLISVQATRDFNNAHIASKWQAS